MKAEKKKKLEYAGWEIGSADELLGLSAEESALVTIRLALAQRPATETRPGVIAGPNSKSTSSADAHQNSEGNAAVANLAARAN